MAPGTAPRIRLFGGTRRPEIVWLPMTYLFAGLALLGWVFMLYALWQWTQETWPKIRPKAKSISRVQPGDGPERNRPKLVYSRKAVGGPDR